MRGKTLGSCHGRSALLRSRPRPDRHHLRGMEERSCRRCERRCAEAIAAGGAGIRLVNEPFVYLDKITVRMFADIAATVRRAAQMEGRTVAVQLRADSGSITEDARRAFEAGACVLMVDTGGIEDLRAVCEAAGRDGYRSRVRIAFAGGVTEPDLEEIIAAGADIVDVGRAIIDAQLLDFRFDVTARHGTTD